MTTTTSATPAAIDDADAVGVVDAPPVHAKHLAAVLDAAWAAVTATPDDKDHDQGVKQPPEPVVEPPPAIKAFTKWTSRKRLADDKMLAALDDDDTFRARIAELLNPDTAGELGWLWLTRPEGWDIQIAAIIETTESELDAEQTQRSHSDRVKALEKRVKTTERRAANASKRRAQATAEVRTAKRAFSAAQRRHHTAHRNLAAAQAALDQAQADADESSKHHTSAERSLERAKSADRSAAQSEEKTLTELEQASTALETELHPPQPTTTEQARPETPRDPTIKIPEPPARRTAIKIPDTVTAGPETAQHLIKTPATTWLIDGYNVAFRLWEDTGHNIKTRPRPSRATHERPRSPHPHRHHRRMGRHPRPHRVTSPAPPRPPTRRSDHPLLQTRTHRRRQHHHRLRHHAHHPPNRRRHRRPQPQTASRPPRRQHHQTRTPRRAAAQHPHRTNRRPTPPHRRHPKPRRHHVTGWAPLKKRGGTQPPNDDDSEGTDMAKTPTPDTPDTTSTDTTSTDTSTEPQRALLTVADNDNGIWVLTCDTPPTEDQPRHRDQLSLHATRLGALLAAHREARRIDGGAKIITEITPPKNLTRKCLPALCETNWRRTWLLVAFFAVVLVTTTASEIWRYPTALGILGGTLTAFGALGLTAAAFTSRSRGPITASDIHHRLVVRMVALTHAGGALLVLAMSAAAQSNTDAQELGAVIVVVVAVTVWLIYALVMSLMDYALEDAARSQPNSHSGKSVDAAP